MKLEIEKSNKPIAIEDIRKFEKKFKLSLPKSYIDFMLENNGGRVNDRSYFKKKRKKDNDGDINEFYSLEHITKLFKLLKKAPDEDAYPDYVIYEKILKENKFPIGMSDYSIVCMDINNNQNNIYYIDLEDDWDLFFVIESFEKFINSFEMRRYPEEPEFEFIIDKGDYIKLKELINSDDIKNKELNLIVEYLSEFGKNTSNGVEKIELLDLLLKKGASKENILLNATRPLKDNYEMVLFFIKQGCDVNVKNDNFITPLLIASLRNKEIVKLLLQYGANPNIKNNKM